MVELEARAATETTNKDLALRLGQIYADQHRSREALAQLERALKLDPNLLAARVARAEVWLRLRQPAQAVKDLEQAVGQAPNDAELQDKLAAAYGAQRDWKRAEQHWRRAVELAPQDSATHRALASGLASAGNAAEALSAAEKATQTDAADGQNWRVLGELDLAAKRYPEAEQALRKAVQLRPDDADANVLLARTLLSLQPNEGVVVGDPKEVYGLLTRALTFDLHHREALLLLGKYYLDRNELDLAVPTLRRARESDPQSAPAREALAEALVRRGDQEEGTALKKQSKP
jgi:cytochrome c-type biogenesis protein CcmH/NrfG